MKEEEKMSQDIIVDTLIERPIHFKSGRRKFCIYPVTLGKNLLFSALLPKLEIDNDNLKENPLFESMRVCSVNKPVAARIIAYAVCKDKDECMDADKVDCLAKYFERQPTEDITSLVNTIMSHDRVQKLIKNFNLDKDIADMRKATAAKNGGNDLSFCGRTIWGQLIDVVCERYGWTMDYVMWGISYTNLQMLLTDQVKTIYLTDEERKKCHVYGRGANVHKADSMTAEEIKKVLNIHD